VFPCQFGKVVVFLCFGISGEKGFEVIMAIEKKSHISKNQEKTFQPIRGQRRIVDSRKKGKKTTGEST